MVTCSKAGPNPEQADTAKRFWIALAFALPVVVVVEMGGYWFGLHRILSSNLWPWIELALATPAVRGWRSLATRHLNMFTLIVMGTGVAWAYRVAAALAPGWLPPAFRASSSGVALYLKAVAAMTVLALLDQALELRTSEQTSGAIRALLDPAPRRRGDRMARTRKMSRRERRRYTDQCRSDGDRAGAAPVGGNDGRHPPEPFLRRPLQRRRRADRGRRSLSFPGILLSPVGASAATALSSVNVIGNALRQRAQAL